MIIGTGQLGKALIGLDNENVCIFTSGVSDSMCVDQNEFYREKKLLLDTLDKVTNMNIVYFSSCALSAPEYSKNEYYIHKYNMEALIKDHSDNYYIFRLPQLFGELRLHGTLINFIYKCIEDEHSFNVYDEAYRYVIEIGDVRTLVSYYLQNHDPKIIVDLANTYRYRVLDIVHTLEILLCKRASYKVVDREDKYILDLSQMLNFLGKYNIDVDFGPDYLMEKLAQKIKYKNNGSS